MDESLIPYGQFCYRIEKIGDGEVLSRDIERFGKDLREYSYFGDLKEVLCPYWIRTDYGTVRCEFLGREVVDEDDRKALAKIARHFGEEAAKTISYSYELADELKICGIREEDPDAPDD